MRNPARAAIVLMLLLITASSGVTHNVENVFSGFDPNQQIERAAQDVQAKIVAAAQAGVPAEVLQPLRFIYWNSAAWPYRVITVCFWNGSTGMQKYVMKIAKVWSDNANLEFSYMSNGEINECSDAASADIRISLDRETPPDLYESSDRRTGDWSMIGRSSLTKDYRVSLSIPDVPAGVESNPVWTRHAIRHEFGHALGLMHEHQRDLCDPWFDFDEIAKLNGWTVEEARRQVGKFANDELPYIQSVGDYDQSSIMQYNFEKSGFKVIPGEVNPCLREKPIYRLSAKDIAGIQALYGEPVAVSRKASNVKFVGSASFSSAQPRSEKLEAARKKLRELETSLSAPARPAQGQGTEQTDIPEQQRQALGAAIDSLDQFQSLFDTR